MQPQPKKYILLIDDDKDLLQLLELRLEREGFEVKSLWNGNNLMDSFIEHRPDLVLMDINMPLVSGNALCKVIKQNASTKKIPVILLSGNENVEKISSNCGADGFILKPVEPAALTNKIRSYL